MVSTMELNLQNIPEEGHSNLARRAKVNPAAFGRLYDYYVQPVFRYFTAAWVLSMTRKI
jgi:hypothetical protein